MTKKEGKLQDEWNSDLSWIQTDYISPKSDISRQVSTAFHQTRSFVNTG